MVPARNEHEWPRYVSEYSSAPDDATSESADGHIPVERLHELTCLVLLGEPGIGKTEVLDRLRRDVVGASSIPIDLGRHELAGVERKFDTEILPKASNLGADEPLHLFFDAVDESPVPTKRLVKVLLKKLDALVKLVRPGRLRLRFASRPVEWPTALLRGLERLLEPFDEEPLQYELLPLEHDGLVHAAREALAEDADDFVANVVARGIEPIARRPVTLYLLFTLWEQGQHELPQARAEIYHRGLRCLLENARYEGREQLRPERRYGLAQLLAGLMLLNNRTSLWAGLEGAETSSSLTVGEVVSVLEPLGTYDPDELGRQLRTLLDDLPLGKREQEGEWHFKHRSFAEFLAAKWLAESSIDERSLVLLLTDDSAEPGRRRVIPQLSGVAAWLADLRQEILERLLTHDPELALLTDLDVREPELKRQAVEALLAALDNDRVDEWEWHGQLGKLRHDGLSGQLRAWIGDEQRHLFARRTAVRIAEECELDDLDDVLRAVVDGPSDGGNLHELAADALIGSLRRAERWDEIYQLALDKAVEDPNESILGEAVRVLWPEHLDLAQLISLCRKPRRADYFGSYRMFLLYELVKGLKEHELLDVLRWFIGLETEWGRDGHMLDEAWGQLMARITTATSLPDRDLAEALVGPLFDGPADVHYGGYPRLIAKFMTVATAERRRAILEVCIERLATQPRKAWHVVHDLGTGDASRLAIAIGMARGDTPEGRVAFEVAWRSSDLVAVEDVERLEKAAEHSPVAREVLQPLLSLGETAEEVVAEVRRRREPEHRSPRPPLDPPPGERVAKRLRQVLDGDVDAFSDLLFRQLVLEPNATRPRQEVPKAIEQTPGWEAANESTREDIGRAAQAWLLETDPHEEEWLGTSTLTGDAITGLLAAGHLFACHPALYAEVPDEIWSRWAMAILSGTSSMNWQDQPLEPLRRGIAADPGGFAERLREHLRQKESSPSVYLRRIDEVWAPELSELMRSLIEEAANDEPLADAVQDYASAWIKHDETGEFVVDDDSHFAEPVRAAIFAAHLRAEPEAHWDRIWPVLEADDDLARLVLFRVAKGQWGRSTFAKSMSTPTRMGALVERLTELFPPEQDPRYNGAHFIGGRENVAELRDGTLRYLANEGSVEAAHTLLAMKHRGLGSSARADLRALAQEAVRRALASEWRPRSLSSLVQLVLGGRRATVYLSSRFTSKLREIVRDRLQEHYAVITTEHRARSTPVFEAIRDDAKRSDVMVQVLEWSSGLGDRDQTGGAWLEQEQLVARALDRELFAAVLQDVKEPSDDLARYLEELRQGHIPLERTDAESLVEDLVASVDDHFERLTQ